LDPPTFWWSKKRQKVKGETAGGRLELQGRAEKGRQEDVEE